MEQESERSAGLGSVYYVATTGNDAAPGTVAAPWRTLQRAVDAVLPGDTVVVAAGSYVGVRITSGGSAAAPKTLKAAAGARPIINAPSPQARHTSIVEVESFDGRIGHWVIDGFEITGSPGAGVDLRDTEHVAVQNCWVHHNGQAKRATGIFMAFSDHPRIVNNESSYNSEHGIYQSNSGDHAVLERNRLHHNTVCGIHMNGDASFGGDGQVSFTTIQGNVIHDNGASGGSAINGDGVSDSLIANNLLYANRASGVSLFQEDGGQPSSRNKLYGNTIVMAAGSRWTVNIPNAGAVGNRIFDNVLYHPDAGRGAISVYAPSAIQSDYNVVVGRFSANNQSSIVGLEPWRALGHDVHSRIATPAELFVDPAQGDFHLKAGAPAIDAGTALAELGLDGDGDARPQGSGVDIGWDERGSGTTPPPTPTTPPPTPTTPPPTPTTPPPTPLPPGCVASGASYTNTAIAPQTGAFTLEWDVTPLRANIDVALAVASGAATRWQGLAAIVRFNTAGTIDARNGAAYASTRSVPYAAGTRYHLRLVIDVALRRYDAFVQPAGGTEVDIARGYAFRTEQQAVTSLDRAVVTSGADALSACNLQITSNAGSSCSDVTAGTAKAQPIPVQTGTFTLVRNVTPLAASLDAAVAVAPGPATTWTSLAAIARFNLSGTIDARNGASYTADRALRYTPNATYRLRFVVDVATHRYSVFVTAPGTAEQTLATNYAFRTEQQSATSLNHLIVRSDGGSLRICE